MSVFARPAFDPSATYKAQRPFTLSGVSLTYEDPVDLAGIEERRVRQMYDARLITMDTRTAEERAALAAAPASPAGKPKPTKAATAAKNKKPAQATKPAPAAKPTTGKPVRVNEGFGKFGVKDAAGELVLTGAPKADADAKLKQLGG